VYWGVGGVDQFGDDDVPVGGVYAGLPAVGGEESAEAGVGDLTAEDAEGAERKEREGEREKEKKTSHGYEETRIKDEGVRRPVEKGLVNKEWFARLEEGQGSREMRCW
jgi:hypothetical protein